MFLPVERFPTLYCRMSSASIDIDAEISATFISSKSFHNQYKYNKTLLLWFSFLYSSFVTICPIFPAVWNSNNSKMIQIHQSSPNKMLRKWKKRSTSKKDFEILVSTMLKQKEKENEWLSFKWVLGLKETWSEK